MVALLLQKMGYEVSDTSLLFLVVIGVFVIVVFVGCALLLSKFCFLVSAVVLVFFFAFLSFSFPFLMLSQTWQFLSLYFVMLVFVDPVLFL